MKLTEAQKAVLILMQRGWRLYENTFVFKWRIVPPDDWNYITQKPKTVKRLIDDGYIELDKSAKFEMWTKYYKLTDKGEAVQP